MNDWISIKYAVPPDGRKILINYHMTDENYPSRISIGTRHIFKNGIIKWKAETCSGKKILCIENVKSFWTVTHWMPLPEPPKDLK